MKNITINKKEIDKFSKLASEWWNPNGKFKPLHKFNLIRMKYILRIIKRESRDMLSKDKPLENLNILDYDYYFKIVDQALKQDIASSLLTFNEIIQKGFNEHNFINGLATHLRNVLINKNPQTIELLEVSDTIKKKYIIQSKNCDHNFILQALEICNECDVKFKSSKVLLNLICGNNQLTILA